ncbi:MAG: hypothetical protein ABWZ86_05110, partial [Hyphomicrobium sp.]
HRAGVRCPRRTATAPASGQDSVFSGDGDFSAAISDAGVGSGGNGIGADGVDAGSSVVATLGVSNFAAAPASPIEVLARMTSELIEVCIC